MKRVRLFGVLTMLVIATLTLGTALATDGNLPGGTPISVEITAPSDGTLVAYPPGDVTLRGTASVGEGVPVANTLIVYVVDVSYSTIRGDGGIGCGGDQNSDGISDTILDCEIAAAKTLNDLAVSVETVGHVGVAVYGAGGAAADVGPSVGDQLITGPATDDGGALGRDVEEVLSSAFSEGVSPYDAGVTQFSLKNAGSDGTNFAAGLTAAMNIVAASDKPNKIVVFMSDGLANRGVHVSNVTVPSGVVIHTFAVGTVSDCTSDPNSLGSLQDIAELSDPDGTCTHVDTVADLPDVVPAVIAAKLLSLSLSVDGGAPEDISGDASLPLPQEDPVSVTYEHTVAGLLPGIHQLCVTATGSDGGGEGEVTECIGVTVADIHLAPPTATNELGTPGQTHTVTAIVAAGADGGVSGVTVNFEILTGPNAGVTHSSVTDGSGEAEFTYTALQGLVGLGTDVIKACFADDLDHEVCDTAEKTWVDTTPPEVACLETVNPHGKKVPPAGSTTPPGPKGGQNEDGFYKLTAWDAVDPDPQIYVVDSGSGTVFGPFPSGTKIKYTEDPTATPTIKRMGSSKGQAGDIDWHIIGNGDADVYAVDASGNASAALSCLVPPPPK